MDQKSAPKMITTSEASRLTGYHQTFFNDKLNNNQIKGEKLANGQWRFEEAELRRYLKSRNNIKASAESYLQGKRIPKKVRAVATPKTNGTLSDRDHVNLQLELNAANVVIEQITAEHKIAMDELKAQIDELNHQLAEANEINTQQKTEIEDLLYQIKDHDMFVRDTFKDFLQIVVNGYAGKPGPLPQPS